MLSFERVIWIQTFICYKFVNLGPCVTGFKLSLEAGGIYLTKRQIVGTYTFDYFIISILP